MPARANEEDNIEFDGFQRAMEAINGSMTRVRTGVSLNQLRDGGAEFELGQVSNREADEIKEDEEETDNGWWTQEQLERQLQEDVKAGQPILTADEDGDLKVDMAFLKQDMDVIYQQEKPLIWKKTLAIGHGQRVTENSTIGFHSVSYLDGSDSPFDSSVMRQRPFLFRLNNDLIVPGLRFAIMTMCVGEKALFILDPSVAYKEMGCPPRIPGNAELLYQVEIIKLYEEGSIGNFLTLPLEQQATYSFDKLLEMADSERKSGNSYFVSDKKRDAGIRYKRAIQVLESRPCFNDQQEKAVKDLLIKLYCNTANTSLAINRPYAAMTFSRKALDIDKYCVKALYFYGKAKTVTGDYDDAERYLTKAAELRPENPDIISALQRLNSRVRADRQTSAELEKKMASIFK